MDILRSGKKFSFKLDGKDAWTLPFTCDTAWEADGVTTVFSFDGGLKVTNVAKRYGKYDTYEWVNFWENTSDEPTGIISELWDCDLTVPLMHEDNKKWEAYLPEEKTATKIYAPTGSTWSKKEFYCDIDDVVESSRVCHISPGESKEYACVGGRSSEGRAPFFNIHKDGEGYICAVGWTGQWRARIDRANDSVTFRSKIEDTSFRLMPGEKIRTSSVVIMPYKCGITDAHNRWRRSLKENFSLLGKEGRDRHGPLCAGIWGGMRTASVLERVERIKNRKLPFEYIWMDAGWYGIDTAPTPDEFEGDWPAHTGDWRVSPQIHPGGLKDVTKAVHGAGMRFLLWFEIERVIASTPIVREHPEYFLSCDDPNDNNRLLDLGNEEAWNYCFKTLSDLIEDLGIDGYRQDFNFHPLSYWRKNDAADRRGITEIKHINGLYRLWDSLLEKFPRLMIDNCASGGRRIDIETLRRSVPLWRSDYMCPADYDVDGVQCHSQTFALWMPYSGTGTGRPYDEYRVRSAYAASMTTNWSFSEREDFCSTEEQAAFIRKYTEEYLKVRPYFSEDFYPLTQTDSSSDVWCGMQFDRPEKKDGIVEIFRRENAPYETAVFTLGGIDGKADYLFADADGGEWTVSGNDLAVNGFRVTVTERRKAKIYFYRAIR